MRCRDEAWTKTAVPVIAFLSGESFITSDATMRAFYQGLNQSGFIEGRNVTTEYRFAEGDNDRLPAMAADLVRRGVAVILAVGNRPAIFAAKAATTTVPIVFLFSGDPVAVGFVASLNRPGGNLTGVTTLNTEIGAKRFELLHELLPTATAMAFLATRSRPLPRVNRQPHGQVPAASACSFISYMPAPKATLTLLSQPYFNCAPTR
jgi:putative tryptophan/tyrosine transport system substrate-binding protein